MLLSLVISSNNPTPYPSGSKTKPNPTLGKSTPAPQQVHQHSLDTQKGPIIGVFHEYAHYGKGKSIHAAGQMEWFNCKVDDRSQHVGGIQSIQTSEGYVIPLH